MSDFLEIERIEQVPEDTYHTTCRGCGRDIILWFNGGELDRTECCGFTYDLQSRGIDFVVLQPAHLDTDKRVAPDV